MDVRVFISFEINTYSLRIRRSPNLGHIFLDKSASYRPGNTVIQLYLVCGLRTPQQTNLKSGRSIPPKGHGGG
jgi:hypothetical protein